MNDNPISLDKLNDIVVPDAVAWWPPAPGWYVLFLALLITISWAGIRILQNWSRNRFRRQALLELETVAPANLPALVKRVSLSIWPREQVASLSGDEWLQFLDQSGNTSAFSKGPGKILISLSYGSDTSFNQDSPEFTDLKKCIRIWIQNATTLNSK